MEFTKGTFQSFTVVRGLHLGVLGSTLPAGTVVQYDGVEMQYGGASHQVPNLRGAIMAGWLTVSPTEVAPQKKAPKAVAAAAAAPAPVVTPTVATPAPKMRLDADEQVVSSVNALRERGQEAAPQQFAASAVQPKSKSLAESAAIKKFGAIKVENGDVTEVGGTEQSAVELGGSEGVPVSRIKSAVPVKVNIDDPAQMRAAQAAVTATRKFPVVVSEDGAPLTAQEKATPTRKYAVVASDEDTAAQESAPKQAQLPSGTSWDMTKHWKTRVKEALVLKTEDPAAFSEVLAIEQQSVVDRIR